MEHDEIRPVVPAERPGPFANNPRMPSDGGLPALGLVMQLGAAMMFCADLMLLLVALQPILPGGRGVMLLIAFFGLIRSVFHYGAGARLADGAIDGRAKARSYVYLSVVHSVVVAVALSAGIPGFQTAMMVYVVLLLLAWPATVLWIISRSAVRDLYARAAVGELELLGRNRGIEGAGALMTAMGVMGIILGVLFGVLLFKGTPLRAGFLGLLMIALVLSLLVRSGFHTAAGAAALRGAGPMDFTNSVKRYVATGVASVALLAVLGFVVMVQAGAPMGLLQFVILAGMLGAWPLIVNGFSHRAGGIFFLETEESAGFGPAEDSGLTALGWVLLGSGAFSLVSALGTLLAGGNPFIGLLSGGVAADTSPQWFISLPTALLTLWAGVELARMTERFKVAAMVYAVVAGVIAIWGFVQSLEALGELGGLRRPEVLIGFIVSLALAAAALVLPVLTLILAFRHRDKVLSLREIFS